MLDSDSVRQNLQWDSFSGQLVVLFVINHAWVTGMSKKGLEIGFASLGNLFKYRNSPRACGLLDTLLEEYCEIRGALSDMILPLMNVEKLHALDADKYQQDIVSKLVKLFEKKKSHKRDVHAFIQIRACC